MRRSFGLLMIVSLLLAACDTEPDTRYDWCYLFNFAEEASWNSAFGVWQAGIGYANDINGNLNLSYRSDTVVNPIHINVTVLRLNDPGDINVRGEGVIFGLYKEVDETLPAEFNSATVGFETESSTIIGQDANISLSASAEFAIQELRIFGLGQSPFGTPNCDGYVPTPTAAPTETLTPFPTVNTATPSPSPTITLTPTVTFTPSPTNTPADEWCRVFDFTGSNGGWIVRDDDFTSGPAGIYTSGTGWETAYWYDVVGSTGGYRDIYISKTFASSNITYISYTSTGTPGIYEFQADGSRANSKRIFVNGNILELESNVSDTFIEWSGNVTTTQVNLHHWVGYNFEVNSDPGGSGTITQVEIHGTGTIPIDLGPENCDITPTPTPTITSTPAPTNTGAPTMTRTPRATWTPRATVTGTRLPTRTPYPVNPPPTSTFIPPTLVPTTTSIPPATIDATPTFITATPGPTSTGDTATPGPTTTGTAVGGTTTPIPGTGTPGPVPGEGDIGDITGIAGNLIAALSNLWNTAIGWTGQLSDRLGSITDAWFNTAPTPPPGAPQCRTNPLEHDVCAIWYILTYTFFAGNMGSLIIPVATGVVDLFLLFVFIKFVRAIIARIGEVFRS